MNRLVAGRVAAGLARYIAERDPAATAAGAGSRAGVVVGYDGRANSKVFAIDAARILSRAGVRVAMLPGALPTPVLAFAVRYERAAYGLMVTASHNPRQDNGIKVYVRDGGQLLPPADEELAAFIDAVDPLALPAGWAEGPFEFASADDAAGGYVAAVAAGGQPGAGAAGLKVVHTALHGVGDATLREVLAAAGWPEPTGVAAQRWPDAAFPTVPYPNPEAPGVLDLARETAEREGADLVLANDPDADRLAVMVPGPGGWRALTGDELGALLGDAVLARLAGAGARPAASRRHRPGGRHHGGLRLAAAPPRAVGRRALRHHADRVQVDRPGGRRRRRPGLRLRAGPGLRGAARPGGRQGRDQRGAARAAASPTAWPGRAGPWPTGSTTSPWPTACTSPGSGPCARTAGRPRPARRRGRPGQEGAAARCWPGGRSP